MSRSRQLINASSSMGIPSPRGRCTLRRGPWGAGRLMEAVGGHQETITEAGSRAAILEFLRRLTVDGVPMEQIVDVVYLLAANGYEDPEP